MKKEKMCDQIMVVAVADNITDKFKMISAKTILGLSSGDFDLTIDEKTKRAYIYFDKVHDYKTNCDDYSKQHTHIVCAPLNDDYTDVCGTYTEHLETDLISFFDAYGNATHTALMFDVVGEDVLITGAGPIGMMAAGICKHNGARNVVITDVNEYRLELARKMGANRPVNVAKEKLEDVMKELGIVEGFDVALEMSGNGGALNQLIHSMRNGGKVALLGIAGPGTVVDWNEIIFKGLNIQGIYGRKMFETWYKMGAMVQAGLDLTPMVTHRFNYRDFEKGFEAMNSGSSGKVVLDWTK